MMNKELLIVDDDLPFRTRLSTSMEKKGFKVESYGEFKKSLLRNGTTQTCDWQPGTLKLSCLNSSGNGSAFFP